MKKQVKKSADSACAYILQALQKERAVSYPYSQHSQGHLGNDRTGLQLEVAWSQRAQV